MGSQPDAPCHRLPPQPSGPHCPSLPSSHTATSLCLPRPDPTPSCLGRRPRSLELRPQDLAAPRGSPSPPPAAGPQGPDCHLTPCHLCTHVERPPHLPRAPHDGCTSPPWAPRPNPMKRREQSRLTVSVSQPGHAGWASGHSCHLPPPQAPSHLPTARLSPPRTVAHEASTWAPPCRLPHFCVDKLHSSKTQNQHPRPLVPSAPRWRWPGPRTWL